MTEPSLPAFMTILLLPNRPQRIHLICMHGAWAVTDDEPSDPRQPFRNATGHFTKVNLCSWFAWPAYVDPSPLAYVGHLSMYIPSFLLSSNYQNIKRLSTHYGFKDIWACCYIQSLRLHVTHTHMRVFITRIWTVFTNYWRIWEWGLICIYGLSFQQYSMYIKRIPQTKALDNIAPLEPAPFGENFKLLE